QGVFEQLLQPGVIPGPLPVKPVGKRGVSPNIQIPAGRTDQGPTTPLPVRLAHHTPPGPPLLGPPGILLDLPALTTRKSTPTRPRTAPLPTAPTIYQLRLQ